MQCEDSVLPRFLFHREREESFILTAPIWNQDSRYRKNRFLFSLSCKENVLQWADRKENQKVIFFRCGILSLCKCTLDSCLDFGIGLVLKVAILGFIQACEWVHPNEIRARLGLAQDPSRPTQVAILVQIDKEPRKLIGKLVPSVFLFLYFFGRRS